MRFLKSLVLAATVIVSSAVVDSAQGIRKPQFNANSESASSNSERDYAALVEGIFAPITAELQLTSGQKFRIVSIITGTIFKADPLMDQLDELDDQINEATLAYPVDENRIRQISAQEAELLSQVIAMKAKAKASIYQLLTPQQRALVTDQFRAKTPAEGRLGPTSN
jgi:Spy/CpxP family protein refolding chaperone